MNTSVVGDEVLELERQYWQALKDLDVDTVMRLTNEPCVVAGPQGVSQIDKQTMAAMMRSATYTLEDFDIIEEQVQQIGEDVAIVAYKVLEQLTVDGKPVTLEAAETSTWVRTGDRWLCAQHSESLIGDPFGRDKQPQAQPKR